MKFDPQGKPGNSVDFQLRHFMFVVSLEAIRFGLLLIARYFYDMIMSRVIYRKKKEFNMKKNYLTIQLESVICLSLSPKCQLCKQAT